jgi:hypothetical protein
MAAPARQPLARRVLGPIGRWAARRATKRVEKEWAEYRRPPQVRLSWLERRRARLGAPVSRSFIQINFNRGRD